MTAKIVFEEAVYQDQIFSFYDDDTNKLLGQYTMTKKTVDGVDVSIDLTNVSFLRIECKDMSYHTAIVEATLYK